MNLEMALLSFMRKIAEENCYNDTLELNTHLDETEILDSLSLLRFIVFIDEEFNVSLTLDDLTPNNIESISTMIELINKKLSAKQLT